MAIFTNSTAQQTQLAGTATLPCDTIVHAEYPVPSNLLDNTITDNTEFKIQIENTNPSQKAPFISEVTLYESNDGGATWHPGKIQN